MKGHALFKKEIITKKCKYIDGVLKKIFSPEPIGQFQPNLAQSILGRWGLQFVQGKGHVLFKGEIITKYRKCIDEIYFKKSSPELVGQFTNKDHSIKKKKMIVFFPYQIIVMI